MAYEFKLANFEGPLELLYQLVKKNEIEISRISLAKITGQYLEYLDKLKSFNLDLASEFTVIAAELLELKASTLLPEDNKKKEDKDKSSSIVRRLQEYHRFKKISGYLQQFQENAANIYYRGQKYKFENSKTPVLNLETGPEELKQAFIRASSSVEKEEKAEEKDIEYIQDDKIKVEDKIEEILTTLGTNSSSAFFRHFINDRNNLMEVVVTLLSILELVRLKRITACQNELFSEIEVYSNYDQEGQVI